MPEFKPSQVKPFFPNSPFQKTEKEVMAAQLVAFLAANGDDWSRPIAAKEFVEFTDKPNENMPDVYHSPFKNPFLAEGCANAIHEFVREGYLTRSEGENATMTVTPKMQEFYAGYVTTAEKFKRGDITKS